MIIAIALLILVVVILGFVLLYTLVNKNMQQMVNQVFGLSSQKIAEQSKLLMSSEKDAIHVDLENKQKTFEKLIATLQEDMRVHQSEIRSLEQDRTKKFGELSADLENHRRLADELKISTQQLASILSNNQLRGEWGERIIEDLMKSNGLIEGVHYLRQTQLESTTLRPDITLILPNKRYVPVDVKFPYAEIQKMALTNDKVARENHLKQFASDIKEKITKVAEYINPSHQTLDYAILFVPNEMVFSFLNQKFPNLIDEAIAKHVLIVSPFTFLIVARTVIESYRNFMIEDKLKDIIQYVSEFVVEWDAFKEEFGKFGRSIDTIKKGYDTLSVTRTNVMERKVKKIEGYRQGSLLE